MARLRNIPFSILDLAPIGVGYEASDALRNSLDLARLGERLGYKRFWVAEHHSMPGIASAATSVVIGHIAAGTSTIRVGAGGVMLPNHAPYVIAEQFGTLEALYGPRIDLGLGRAPGGDPATTRTLRRRLISEDAEFPELLTELRFFLNLPLQNQKVEAIPGAGSQVPIWLLGSSGFSARLAAQLGLPFAFAAHFSPENMMPALYLYRTNFRPSATLDAPCAIVAINVFAADTNAEAERIATSQHQSFLNMLRGRPGKIPPPVDDMDAIWSPKEKTIIQSKLGGSVIGDPETVVAGLKTLIEHTAADELMINAIIYDHSARMHSYEIVAAARNGDSNTAGDPKISAAVIDA